MSLEERLMRIDHAGWTRGGAQGDPRAFFALMPLSLEPPETTQFDGLLDNTQALAGMTLFANEVLPALRAPA